MPITKKDWQEEEKRLDKVLDIIRRKISELGAELYEEEEKQLEFKKFLWESHTDMDPTEMKTMMSNNDVEITIIMKRGEYFQKLFKIQNKPYFASIIFTDNKEKRKETIYIGITHVEENLEYYVHDWRSPICNLYYDYETGPSQYIAPEGTIKGIINRKRQYIIENAKLINIFDNSINIDDELLQKVLAKDTDEKMKNIVNTIQKEQNQVIRNTKDKNLIVEGIAGSGKTSVALHRVAFLLYKIENLTTEDILIFSPNKIFTQYISNVLPELGEKNTKETSYHEYLMHYLKEFKEIETFTHFIEKYYQDKTIPYELICYKQSDNITKDIDNYLEEYINNTHFTKDLINRDYEITKEELNQLLHIRYKHFPFFKRIDTIATKLCDKFYYGKMTKKKSLYKVLLDSLNIEKNYINIYNNFYQSKYSKIKTNQKMIINKKQINYEDATLLIYIKFYLDEIDYNTSIKQIVIDEAQDYTKTEYLIIKKLFRNANYTILGDVNQTINPYYKYQSLNSITTIFNNSKYIELLKTYRSSPEIIEYTNKILNLNHISAIRRHNKKEVIERTITNNLNNYLIKEIKNLSKEYKSVAIITKSTIERDYIYSQIRDKIQINKMEDTTQEFKRNLVILPSYLAKGLEFDAVIVYTTKEYPYEEHEKYLFYVACTRCQHQLIIYHQK